MKTIRVRIEIDDKEANRKKVGWTRITKPSRRQLQLAQDLYRLLLASDHRALRRAVAKVKALTKNTAH